MFHGAWGRLAFGGVWKVGSGFAWGGGRHTKDLRDLPLAHSSLPSISLRRCCPIHVFLSMCFFLFVLQCFYFALSTAMAHAAALENPVEYNVVTAFCGTSIAEG